MLVKNLDISLLNSSGITIGRMYLTRKKPNGKNIAIAESLTTTLIKKLKFKNLKMFGYLMGKFYSRMDQEIKVYFMTNPI